MSAFTRPETPVRIALAAAASAMLTALTVVAAVPAQADAVATESPVTAWADRHALPIQDVDRPGPDLGKLGAATRDAQIVASASRPTSSPRSPP